MDPFEDFDGVDGIAASALGIGLGAAGGAGTGLLYELMVMPTEKEVEKDGVKTKVQAPLVESAGLRAAILAVGGIGSGFAASLWQPSLGAGIAGGAAHALAREAVGLVQAKMAAAKAKNPGVSSSTTADAASLRGSMFSPYDDDFEAEAALAGGYRPQLHALPEEEELLADPDVVHEDGFAEVDVQEDELATLSAVVA